MTAEVAASPLFRTLQAIDTSMLRESPAEMWRSLRAVVDDPGSDWSAGWADLVSMLRSVGRVDLCLARLVEGHADALRIFDQAASQPKEGVYGVWASRSVGSGLSATYRDDRWELSGRLLFASGIDLIDRALVPGWLDADRHLLFDVPVAELTADRESWASAAMDASRSFSVDFPRVAAGTPVGDVGFYLGRAGFIVGGIGPAAVWSGGAHQVADLVATGLRAFTASPHQRVRLGRVEQAVWAADAAMQRAIDGIGSLPPNGTEVKVAVAQARTAVTMACDMAIAEAQIIVGPGGLSSNARLARTLADLAMYVRQHHLDGVCEMLGTRSLAAREVLGE